MCAVFILGGIDKETYEIHEGTILYGIVVALAYGIFNAIRGMTMWYALAGFIIYPAILLLINFVMKKIKKPEDLPIGFGDIEYLALVGLFLGFGMQTLTVVLAIIVSVIYLMILKLRNKNVKMQIPFGFMLSISTSLIIVFAPYCTKIADLINITMI
jgi:leader peptidase (prepilin peptidase)/N-methyltransferase